jgi:hypothetical protein
MTRVKFARPVLTFFLITQPSSRTVTHRRTNGTFLDIKDDILMSSFLVHIFLYTQVSESKEMIGQVEEEEEDDEEDEDIKDDIDVSDAASMSEVQQLLGPVASSLLLKGVTDRYFCN